MFTRQGDRDDRVMKKKQDDQLSYTSKHSQTVSNPPAHSQTEFIKKKSKRTKCLFPKVFPMSFLQRPIAISTTGRNYKTKHTRVWPPLYRSFLSFVGIWNSMRTRNSILLYLYISLLLCQFQYLVQKKDTVS